MTRQGDWIQTYTGKQYWPIDPRTEDVRIEDIAHALSMLCRFGGHCLKFYSVAEHSVHIARWLYPRYGAHVALCGLMHDGTEAYVPDVTRPLKPSLTGFKAIEQKNWREIAATFDLPESIPQIVKEADNRALAEEARQNMAACIAEWSTMPEPLGFELQYWQPDQAEAEFLAAFHELNEIAEMKVAA